MFTSGRLNNAVLDSGRFARSIVNAVHFSSEADGAGGESGGTSDPGAARHESPAPRRVQHAEHVGIPVGVSSTASGESEGVSVTGTLPFNIVRSRTRPTTPNIQAGMCCRSRGYVPQFCVVHAMCEVCSASAVPTFVITSCPTVEFRSQHTPYPSLNCDCSGNEPCKIRRLRPSRTNCVSLMCCRTSTGDSQFTATGSSWG